MTPLDTIQAPFKALANTGIFLSLTLRHAGEFFIALIENTYETTGPFFPFLIILGILFPPLGIGILAALVGSAIGAGASVSYDAKDTYYPLESNPEYQNASFLNKNYQHASASSISTKKTQKNQRNTGDIKPNKDSKVKTTHINRLKKSS